MGRTDELRQRVVRLHHKLLSGSWRQDVGWLLTCLLCCVIPCSATEHRLLTSVMQALQQMAGILAW